MRTLNVQLVAVLGTIGIVFGSSVYLLHAYQVRRNAYVFMRQAERFEERAEQATKRNDFKSAQQAYSDATRSLRWYVRLVPRDVEGLEKLGVLVADTSQDYRSRNEAFSLLERVLREDPERSKARRRLVAVAVDIGRFQDAKQHLQEFLLKDFPNDPELWDLLGRCSLGTGEFHLARDYFKKAIKLSPTQIGAYSRLARVLHKRLSLPAEARLWMDEVVQRNPKNGSAHYERGLFLNDMGASSEAIKETSKSLELNPDNSDALALATRCHTFVGNIEKAREYAARRIKLYPQDPGSYLNMVDIELATRKHDKAIAMVRQGLQVVKQNPQLLWALANLLIDANNLAEAKQTFDQLHAINYPMPFLQYLDARMEMARGHWFAARQGFEKVRGHLIAPGLENMLKQADLLIGQCYGQLSNRDQQIDAFRRATRTDPLSQVARLDLAEALVAAGSIDEAVRVYRETAELRHFDAPSLLLLARVLVMRNLRQAPAARDWGAVDKLIDVAEKAVPSAVDIPIMRAEMLVGQKRPAEAEALLQKALKKTPGKPNSG